MKLMYGSTINILLYILFVFRLISSLNFIETSLSVLMIIEEAIISNPIHLNIHKTMSTKLILSFTGTQIRNISNGSWC